jgi:hypothetical protein
MEMGQRSVMICWWVATDVSRSSAETLYAVSTAGTYCAGSVSETLRVVLLLPVCFLSSFSSNFMDPDGA